jgi:aspartate/methionine/tyrosine aminotransferase
LVEENRAALKKKRWMMEGRLPVAPIAPFKLERYFARWEFAAPYLLCTSDVQGYRLRDLLALADAETRALWEDLTLGYTESAGHPLLRAEIAGLYERAGAADVLCFAGAEEAIYIALRVLLRPGDHAIVTFPGYQSSYQVAEAAGAQVSHWRLRLERWNGKPAWMVDLDELRGLLRPETRVILVNFPHNPTGALLSQVEWADVVEIARQAGCYLFSDEVYRLLEYDPGERLAPAVDLYEKGLSLGVMSKPFGLAGLRIGWVAARDVGLLAELAAYKDYTTICNSAPSEILALMALRAREQVLARCLDLLRANLGLVEECMGRLADRFEWIPPQAGSICFPRWLGHGSIEEFSAALVEAEGVLLLPGTVFDYPGEYFRLGLGRENLPEALDRLERFARRYGHA